MPVNPDYSYEVLYNKLNKHFEGNINLSSKTRNKIFIITKNDMFYEINIFEENIRTFVLDDDYSIIESMIVQELCNKKIIDLIYGYCHYIARTIDNKIFCWGNNSWGQLGNGKKDNDLDLIMTFINIWKQHVPLSMNRNISYFDNFNNYKNDEQIFNEILIDQYIINLKCGFGHSLALSKSGEVYAWGCNINGQIGNGSEEKFQLIPVKIECSKNEKVVMISCGFHHSMALTESGRVFSWGYNSSGQLGHGNTVNSNKPKEIILKNISMRSIACGQRHSLVLSTDGDIYAFGNNEVGQLGTANTDHQLMPVLLKQQNKFIRIASHFEANISISLSENDLFYIWGHCKGLADFIIAPLETIHRSFDDVFLQYTNINYEREVTLTDFAEPFSRDDYYRKGYIEIEELGRGSYGIVYKVESEKRSLAVKKIKPSKNLEKEFLKEFINYSVIKSLDSDYFVKHFDAWFENNISMNKGEISFYIEMELCDKSLDDLLDEFFKDYNFKIGKILTQIGFYIASQLFIEILECVQFLHTQNIIHRDLNPNNIMLKREVNNRRFIKIADFGIIAIHKYPDRSHTTDIGTHRYMAPEVSYDSKYGTIADIYSLGVVLMKLFHIDVHEKYDGKKGMSKILKLKYDKSMQLISKMTRRLPNERPNCEKILALKDLWALHENEFEFRNESESILNSRTGSQNFSIYSILELKLKQYSEEQRGNNSGINKVLPFLANMKKVLTRSVRKIITRNFMESLIEEMLSQFNLDLFSVIYQIECR